MKTVWHYLVNCGIPLNFNSHETLGEYENTGVVVKSIAYSKLGDEIAYHVDEIVVQ